MNRGVLLAIIVRLASLFTSTLSLPLSVKGQLPAEPRTLSGTVYYAGGDQPAENISVELHNSEGNMIAPQTTSSNGWVELRGLPRSVYVIALNAARLERVDIHD